MISFYVVYSLIVFSLYSHLSNMPRIAMGPISTSQIEHHMSIAKAVRDDAMMTECVKSRDAHMKLYHAHVGAAEKIRVRLVKKDDADALKLAKKIARAVPRQAKIVDARDARKNANKAKQTKPVTTTKAKATTTKAKAKQTKQTYTVTVWPGMSMNDPARDIPMFEEFVATRFSFLAHPVKIIGSIGDDFMFAINDADIPKFTVPRIQYGIRWLSDVVSNNPDAYDSDELERLIDGAM